VAPPGSQGRTRGASRFEVALVLVLALGLLVPGIWRYSLVDPWETHYAEVSRRMLQDHDWIHLDWQNEGFRSKPVLSFWMMAASMRAMGLAENGGYSGEMASSDTVVLAVRLPFVLFGALGLVLLWWMLASLVSRRVAWLAFLIVGTTPFYFLVARQAITDMPMVACLMGAMACFAMAMHAGDAPLQPIWRRINALHLFLAALVLFVGWQIVYDAVYFSHRTALPVRFPAPHIVLPLLMLLGLIGFVVWALVLDPTRHTRQVYMYWFYALLGVSVLAKGPPALGLAGLTCLLYILITRQWSVLRQVEIPRGILLCALIAVPWHAAMWLTDGRPFLRDYLINHLWRRATVGAHSTEQGTFIIFLRQIGIGMWPWVGLLPAAVASLVSTVRGQSREGRVRLIIGIWAITSVAFFSAMQTKFHHYILPAIPALGVLVAFFLDDLLAGRVRRLSLVAMAAAAIVLLITRDFMGEQKQLIELFVYRYDRPWPQNEPWGVDLSDPILAFGLIFAALMLLLSLRGLRKAALYGMLFCAVLFGYWLMNVYMSYAGMHWGQREAVAAYYQQRQIHGIHITYYGARQVADEWDESEGYMIRTVVPEHLSPGQPMTVEIKLESGPRQTITMHGEVSRIGDDRFWITLPGPELAKIEALVQQGRGQKAPARPPQRVLDADRLIAWQLYWRGENFWSGDEIFGRTEETRTVFKETDNKAFLNYLERQGKKGRRYFVVTEAGRANNLRTVLPTERAKDSYEILDRSSNKFTLMSFTL
jgi:4-amino-4-deoxy-L-arabinose transferase-like glycosyltransferase